MGFSPFIVKGASWSAAQRLREKTDSRPVWGDSTQIIDRELQTNQVFY